MSFDKLTDSRFQIDRAGKCVPAAGAVGVVHAAVAPNLT